MGLEAGYPMTGSSPHVVEAQGPGPTHQPALDHTDASSSALFSTACYEPRGNLSSDGMAS